MRQAARGALDRVIVVNEASARRAHCEVQRGAGHRLGIDGAVRAPLAAEERIDQWAGEDREPFADPPVAAALAAQQAGPQHVEPPDADFGQLAVGLPLDLEVEIIGVRIGAD